MRCQRLQVFGMNSKYEALIAAFLAQKKKKKKEKPRQGYSTLRPGWVDPCPAASVAAVMLSDCIPHPPSQPHPPYVVNFLIYTCVYVWVAAFGH